MTEESIIQSAEALYRRITSHESRKAADWLFSATPAQLREAYQPGRTESSQPERQKKGI